METGETLNEAAMREVREETQLAIAPVGLAGHREAIKRDADDRVERHFVILCLAARWLSGEPVLNEELDDARWVKPAELARLRTTEGLAEIGAAALALIGGAQTSNASCVLRRSPCGRISLLKKVNLREEARDPRLDAGLCLPHNRRARWKRRRP